MYPMRRSTSANIVGQNNFSWPFSLAKRVLTKRERVPGLCGPREPVLLFHAAPSAPLLQVLVTQVHVPVAQLDYRVLYVFACRSGKCPKR